VAVSDHATGGTEDAPQSGNVLTDPATGDHDTAPDSDPLTVTGVTGGTVGNPIVLTYGTLTLNSSGAWTFVPNSLANALPAGALVQETVTYTVSDGNGGVATATLTIDVNGVNDAPVLITPVDPQEGTEGHPVILDLKDRFADVDSGDVLTFSVTGLPPGLSIDAGTGLISGTPAPNSSAGGPYTVTVTVSDGHGGTVSTTFAWKVVAENFSENPRPQAPENAPLPAWSFTPAIVHPVSDAVNGLENLKGTPAFGDLAITRTVDQISSLNSALDLEPGDGVIERLVDWAGRQGRDASWIHDLFEKMDHEPYAGDSRDLSLGLDGTDLFSVKSVLHDGALFIGIDELTHVGDVVNITVVGGRGVVHIGTQDLIVDVMPGEGWIDLAVVGQTKDGKRYTWSMSVNAHSGEVISFKTKSGLPKLADLIVRGNATFTSPILTDLHSTG
jgi:VCBS repeat-containing protein